jgi:hypothetical protein
VSQSFTVRSASASPTLKPCFVPEHLAALQSGLPGGVSPLEPPELVVPLLLLDEPPLLEDEAVPASKTGADSTVGPGEDAEAHAARGRRTRKVRNAENAFIGAHYAGNANWFRSVSLYLLFLGNQRR